MDLKLDKIKKSINVKNLPFIFERYEIFIIIVGVVVVFLLALFVFYKKAYITVNSSPDVDVEVKKVRSELFEQTIDELEQRKQMAPDLPIIDPFR